eukprot:6209189-Pleurochrysis_carterae.AAC.1
MEGGMQRVWPAPFFRVLQIFGRLLEIPCLCSVNSSLSALSVPREYLVIALPVFSPCSAHAVSLLSQCSVVAVSHCPMDCPESL